MNRRFSGKLIAAFCSVFVAGSFFCTINAQTTLDTVRAELGHINSVFDSAFYLSFDVRITYKSDTLWAGTDSAQSSFSQTKASYTVNGSDALYSIGDLEYLQNSKYVIAVYKGDRSIMVGKRPAGGVPSSLLPNRMILDSMLNAVSINYSVSYTDYDSIRHIEFQSLDTLQTYQRIAIEYEPETYHMVRMNCDLKDYSYGYNTVDGLEIPELLEESAIRYAQLSFDFSGYRVERIGADVFSETRYLFFDGPEVFRPADAYKDFNLYKSF